MQAPNAPTATAMTLRELRYLVAIAEHRHFGRAAESCHVTQPTLSAQLRKLEDYLGLALIDRSGKQPVPTPAGEQIVERARRLLAEADAILQLTRQRVGPLQGVLNVGLIPTLAPYLLPWLLRIVQAEYPRLHLVVHEDMTRHLADKLDEQLLDVAFLALPAPFGQAGRVEHALFNEPFFVACPAGHEISAYPAVPARVLADLKLMLLTDGHCLRGQALAACGQSEAQQSDAADFRATSLETLIQLVACGLGCTLLPALAVRHLERTDLAIRPLAAAESRRIGMVWRHGHPRHADLELLGARLRQLVPEGALALSD